MLWEFAVLARTSVEAKPKESTPPCILTTSKNKNKNDKSGSKLNRRRGVKWLARKPRRVERSKPSAETERILENQWRRWAGPSESADLIHVLS